MIALGSNLIWVGRMPRPTVFPEGWDGEGELPDPGFYSGWQAMTTAEVLAAYPDLSAHVISPATPSRRLQGDGEPPWDTVIIRVLSDTEAEAKAVLAAIFGFDPWEAADGPE